MTRKICDLYIPICDEFTEVVPEFRYLGFVKKHMVIFCTRASRGSGTLCKPVFSDGHLSVKTKRIVYKAVIRGVLLFGAES